MNHKKSISPLKEELDRKRIIALDTEDDSCGNVKQIDFCWKEDGELKHATFEGAAICKRAVEWLYRQPTSVVVAHNLEYDIVNLFRDLNYCFIADIVYTSRLIKATLTESDHVMMDSFSWFPMSLAKLAKNVGMEKTKLDLSSADYVHNDTEILYVAVEKFQDKLLCEMGVNLRPTIGGLAMASFRGKFLSRSIVGWNHPICLDAFYGGRCESFYIGDVVGNVNVADINSAYMRAMLNPFPNPESMRECKFEECEFGVGKFHIECPKDLHLPVLPHKYQDRLMFPVGKWTGSYTFHEIRYAQEFGYKVKPLKCYGTNESERYFIDYDTHFYEERLKAKEQKDAFGDTFNKGLGVNLFGKFIQHKDRTTLRLVPYSNKELRRNGATLVHKLGPFFVYNEPYLEPPSTACYIWGCYVPSYCRIGLHKILNTIHSNGDTVLYTDTDSAFFLGNKSIPHLDLDEKRLGALKIEKFRRGKFIGAKTYILKPQKFRKIKGFSIKHHRYLFRHTLHNKVKIACKGVPQTKGVRIDSLQNAQYEFIETGRTLTQKPVRLKQSYIQNKKGNEWITVPKIKRNPYTKRIGFGVTTPLIIEE